MAKLSNAELARLWKERVEQKNFSASVRGVGTVRIMGKAGDAPVSFPRIESLAALSQLEPEEQWAVRAAEDYLRQARDLKRSVMAVPPAREGVQAIPRSVTSFDPNEESYIVVARVAGG